MRPGRFSFARVVGEPVLSALLSGIVANLYTQRATPPTLSSELGTTDNDVIVTAASQEAGFSQIADDVVYPGGNLEHTYTPRAGKYVRFFSGFSDDNVLYSEDVDVDILQALNPGNSK